MTTARYKWSGAGGIRGLKAQQVGEELERIRTLHNGRLTPKDVVQAAERKGSPLHRYFEWNDAKAGIKHRITQAGCLIRSIEVVVEVKKGPSRDYRAFVSVRRDKDRSYTSLGHALSDADMRKQLLAEAWREIEGWRKRYATLSEFTRVFRVIDKMPKPKGI